MNDSEEIDQPAPINKIEYAGFGLRFVAFFTDFILLGLFNRLLIQPNLGLIHVEVPTFDVEQQNKINDLIQTNPNISFQELLSAINFNLEDFIIILFISTLVQWLYYAHMESSKMQGTVGKFLLGIKVTDLNGSRISFVHASARYFAKFISLFTFGIGYLMVLFTEKKQALHDIISKCLVVKKLHN